MSHVDDGQIEAWLDRERSGMDARESTEIADHLGVCAVCASRMEAARRVRDRADQILGTTRLTDAGLPDFERVRARASGVITEEPRRPGAGRRRLVAFAWAASVVGAIGFGWVTRDLLAPRPLAFDVSSGRTSEAAARAPTASESVLESPSTENAVSPRASAGSVVGVAGAEGLVGQGPTTLPAAASTRAFEATSNSSRAAAQPIAEAAPAAAGIGAGSIAAIETDPTLARDQAALGPDPGGFGAIPSVDALLALGYSRQGFSLQDAGRDTIADIFARPAALALGGVVRAGSDRNRAAETSGGAPPPSALEAVGDGPASPRSGAAAPAEAIFAPSTGEARNADWPGMPVDMSQGARRLGSPPVAVPDLEILAINLVETADGPIVHLRQRLLDGGILLLVQRVGPSSALPSKPAEMNTAEARRGPLYVTAVAPLSQEELGDLLDSAR